MRVGVGSQFHPTLHVHRLRKRELKIVLSGCNLEWGVATEKPLKF
jgi:hypothetical protein